MALRFAGIAAGLTLAFADKLNDLADGVSFSKCIKIEDIETKTMDDDITLTDREAEGGCCPSGTVPGVKFASQYMGAQVVCGFKDDGTVALSTSSSNSKKTCTYNSCFIMKQNLACADGSTQRINGCCAPKADCTSSACGFKDSCKHYALNFNSAHSESTEYCTTYHNDYGTIGFAGTSDKADDIATSGDVKTLATDKVYVYARCEGGGSGGSGGSSGNSGDDASNAVKIVSAASGSVVAAFVVAFVY